MAILLLNANRVVSTDTLIDELWGEDPPETATKIIHNGVSQLRRVLPDASRLETRAPGYLLRVEPGELDADQFARLALEGRQALDENHADVAVARLSSALELWKGHALADVPLEGAVHSETARLEELRLTVVEDRNEAQLALGGHRKLVGELEALVAEHPLRERLRAQLVLALYRAGRQAEALDAYRRARRFFVDELGLEPSPELQRLEQAVLRQDPSLELESVPRVERTVEQQAAPRENRKLVTVLFADLVVGGDGLDPESVRPVSERVAALAANALEKHGASVERPAAGGVIGVFGLPIAHEDDALRAARAAVDVRDAVRAVDEELASVARFRVDVRAGIHTGVVVAPASGARVPVAGDAVASAARLASSAEAGEILLGTDSEKLVRAAAQVQRSNGGRARLVAVDADAVAIPRGLGRPMIGRERELDALLRALHRAESESTAYLFTILGPAGIGKSRLAREFEEAVRHEATVLAGRCLPYGEGITFSPLAEVVREAAGELSREAILRLLDGDDQAERVADSVAAAVGVGSAAGTPEDTFWAARRLMQALAERRPLVLVFDDLHWAEPTFLNLVEHIADGITNAPILIVCLARPELVEERRWWGGGKLNATSLLLEPLSQDESDELIENLLGGVPVSADARVRAAEAADGNPLFLEQLLLMVVEEGASLEEVEVPPTIHLLLEARLDRLDPEERVVLERAAVVGREFSEAAIVAVTPDDERADVVRRLEQLQRRELIRGLRDRSSPGRESYRFRHTLVRETAYRSVPKEVRAALHEQFADWAEHSAPAQVPEIIGIHLEQAYRYRMELAQVGDATRTLARRAAERLGDAGRRASSLGDVPAALRLLGRAEALLAGDADRERERLDLMLDLADALRETGDFRRARAVLDDVTGSARGSIDEVLRAQTLVLGAQLDLQTDPGMKIEEILTAAETAIEIFERAGDEIHLAQAWRLRGHALWFRCRAAEAEESLMNAIASASAVGDRRTEAQALNLAVGAAFYGPLPIPEAVRRFEEILARPDEHRRISASAMRALAGMRAMEGRFDEGRALLHDSRAMLEDLGLHVSAAAAAETAALVELLAGDAEAAERELRAGAARLTEMGRTSNLPILKALLAQALVEQGRDEEAFRLTEESDAAAAADDLFAQVQWRSARAKALARMGRVDEADTFSADAVALAGTTDFLVVRGDSLVDRAIVLAAAGSREVEATLRAAIELYEQKGATAARARAKRLLE